MAKELQNRQIADFALNKKFEDIPASIIDQLKKHLLDSLGSLFCAIPGEPIQKLLRQLVILGDNGKCLVPVLDGLPFDRAAQLYTALIRYPDFMDNFMGKEATCHPSDNIGSLLAASQFNTTNGKEFLTAMAIAYQVECRLVIEIPVMAEGIDHTLLLAYSIAAASSRLMKLTHEQTAHALAIAGCSLSPLVTSRASYTYEWKGLASSLDALTCINNVLLAREGVTGPIALFEGPKGFDEVFRMKLDYDWSKENFDLIQQCVLKNYNAEVHSQSVLEAVIKLREEHTFLLDDIERIDVTTFLTCYHIIGGGMYGDRKTVHSKEQADHSLFYLVAVALLDGEVYPAQFTKGRIESEDVQNLLQKVFVDTKFHLHKPVKIAGILDPYTQAYPKKMKAKVEIKMKNGDTISCENEDYYGFHTRPFSWEHTIQKFKRLSHGIISSNIQEAIIEKVKSLEKLTAMTDFIKLIAIGND